jgi:hypothetical protein
MPIATNFTDDVLPNASILYFDTREESLPVSVTVLLNLCGGIPAPDVSNVRVEIYGTYSSAFTIKVFTDQYEAYRSVDFSIGRIDNNYLFVNEQGDGLGTNLFLNQYQAARALGFRRIHLTAMAPFEDEPHWNGHYFWACLGFRNADTAEFAAWATAMGRDEPTLTDLIQTEEGREMWKRTGFTWLGDFFLAEHDCITQLKTHLQRKGIAIEID